ncbi:PGF-CTERM sorting domain-containing protein [Halobaculum sp. WSA2]|uniref:PGF-CTERM sorting domain-containing protein n=1 Tax=Halobaculum saliterrae TaxID=2073113 RepID=A0A6B0T026_9EURY|nr:PGF-CTERM sorting domain-containing protein [Halobaculum saliterrae]MXR41952.1 PGF-CTERM sorting domain-containing protein [Halobaculum saliterrae]
MNARSTLPALVLLSVLVGAVALTGGLAAGTATAQTTNATADVSVDDQTGAESVTVAEATLPDGGFVVVYNASGGIVGVSEYLDEGTHEDVTLEVSPAFSRSQVVVGEVRTDDGDESFNASADQPYTNENGQPIGEAGYVTVEQTETATPTATATATETATATDGGDDTTAATDEPTETSGPGFGVAAALVALVGAALLARR